jgi:hypothetical protein
MYAVLVPVIRPFFPVLRLHGGVVRGVCRLLRLGQTGGHRRQIGGDLVDA